MIRAPEGRAMRSGTLTGRSSAWASPVASRPRLRGWWDNKETTGRRPRTTGATQGIRENPIFSDFGRRVSAMGPIYLRPVWAAVWRAGATGA